MEELSADDLINLLLLKAKCWRHEATRPEVKSA
jgi:hypothetical protein